MKYATKEKRLMAIVELFQKVQGGGPISLGDAAAWAFDVGLWPVPKRGDPEAECIEWERHLESLVPVQK